MTHILTTSDEGSVDRGVVLKAGDCGSVVDLV
jgi:hypothetical protein